MADFNVFEGQVWSFNHEECIADLSNFDTSRMDVFAGLDVGYKDPTAFCVMAYDWDEEKFYLVDEYLDSERTTEQHAIERSKYRVGLQDASQAQLKAQTDKKDTKDAIYYPCTSFFMFDTRSVGILAILGGGAPLAKGIVMAANGHG